MQRQRLINRHTENVISQNGAEGPEATAVSRSPPAPPRKGEEFRQRGRRLKAVLRTRSRGMVLVIVLVVLALLALGAYSFAELMRVEAQAASAYGREVQARSLADSGVEMAASLLYTRDVNNPEQFWNNPEQFQGVVVREPDGPRGAGRFSLVVPVENGPATGAVRYGLADESSKININAISALKLDNQQARLLMMNLPGMTEDIADAILDWVDTDSTPRETGAEADAYSGMGFSPKNGPIDSLDELLRVRGVTPWLLFGEDANRNGLLDPPENDGEASLPVDDGDGILNAGWSSFLTVHSRESNLQPTGLQKINVNGSDLAALYDQILPLFDAETAQFIVAFRVGSTAAATGAGTGGTGGSGSSGGGGRSGSKSGSSQSGVGTGGTGGSNVGTGGTGGNKVGTGGTGGSVKSAAGTGGTGSSLGGSNSGGGSGGGGGGSAGSSGAPAVTRGGINVGGTNTTQVSSLFQLIGAKVTATVDGKSQELTSPFTSEPAQLTTSLPKLVGLLSISADPYIQGRININQARLEVLLGIPNMPPDLAQAIVANQTVASGQAAAGAGQVSPRATTGWLLANGLTDLATLQKLDPYITARGDVYRFQSIGYFDGSGQATRLEAVIDATEVYPKIIFLRDLAELGRGYSSNVLTTGAP